MKYFIHCQMKLLQLSLSTIYVKKNDDKNDKMSSPVVQKHSLCFLIITFDQTVIAKKNTIK